MKFLTHVAREADLSMKPFVHTVKNTSELGLNDNCNDDYFLKIESRDVDGNRLPGNDLDIEIYRSGNDINVVIAWSHDSTKPILWYGRNSVWMNSDNGIKCPCPSYGDNLEVLAKRLKSYISKLEDLE